MRLVLDPEHPQAHQPRCSGGECRFRFREPGGLRDAMLVVAKDDHRRSRVGLFRSGLVGLLKRAIVGLLGWVLGGFFALRNEEGGRSPLVRSAVLAAWSFVKPRRAPCHAASRRL